MAALKGRIARLRELGMMKASELHPGVTRVPEAADTSPDTLEESGTSGRNFLSGWRRAAPHVHFRILDTSLELPVSEAAATPECCDLRLFEWERDDSRYWPLEDFSFLDFETTGLSGGTGTIAFLAAIGFFEGGVFRLAQVFLDDFPGEAGLLEEVQSLLARRPFLVTYNGKAFDYPLLRTRCVMNALKSPDIAGHIDLLHVARRLWKRTIGTCSLKAMEEAVLGVPRGEDIPGFLIPGIWLDYVSRKGPPGEQLEAVVEHNAQDVVSLARLFLKVRNIMENPASLALRERVDTSRMARALQQAGREDEALGILWESASGGDQRALCSLARYYRRRRIMDRYAEAVGLMDETSIQGRIEKAKYEEHCSRNLEAALHHVRQAMMMTDGLDEKLATLLRLREARIEGKLNRPGKAVR